MKPSYFWAKVKSVGATLGFEAMHVEGAVAEVKRAAKTNRKHFKLEIGTMCNAQDKWNQYSRDISKFGG